MMPDVLIGFGANLGEPNKTLEQVADRLRAHPQIRSIGVSAPIITPPVGSDPNQRAYTNAAIRIATNLQPGSLLQSLLNLERELGRIRAAPDKSKWQPRCIDLDLLLYGNRIIQDAEMTIPHPRMTFRRFVLHPACEIAADMVHPVSGVSLAQLLEILDRKNFLVLLAFNPERDVQALLNPLVARDSEFDFVWTDPHSVLDLDETGKPRAGLLNKQQVKLCCVNHDDDYERLRDHAQLVVVLKAGDRTAGGSAVGAAEANQSKSRNWPAVAGAFPGPCLILNADDAPGCRREILAACQAMRPF